MLLAATLSCAEATAPRHEPLYDWRWVIGTDTLSFHWPSGSLPVRIWVEDSLDMPERIREGIATWRAAYLYGEYDAEVVSDSADADVIVRVADAPPKAPSSVGRLHTALPGCEGLTDFDIDTVATPVELRLPVRMYLTPKYDPELVDLTECFRVTATHELGHSLGIFRHTSDTLDIMYSFPQATSLSVRDVNTAQFLAHWPANMTPTR
jgi:predicted Zn-dependent protease